MGKIIDFMIAHLDEATDINVTLEQRKAGIDVTMNNCNTTASFRLFDRRVSIEYWGRLTVTVLDDARKPIHEIADGRELMKALLARGTEPSLRQVFPAAFEGTR